MRVAGAVVGLAILIAGAGFFLLAVADYITAGNGSPDPLKRAEWVRDRGDHVHFAGHILMGRALDLCPCTRRAASTQYYRAHFHAVTPRQTAVATNTHPSTPGAWADYVIGPVAVSLDWVGDGVGWLSGRRPAAEVVVDLGEYQMNPGEVRVSRGTRVTWRNVDELGEAHSVTADGGQVVWFDSDYLEPDESFSFTFTERGRFKFYCRAHGEPGSGGMSGVVVVF